MNVGELVAAYTLIEQQPQWIIGKILRKEGTKVVIEDIMPEQENQEIVVEQKNIRPFPTQKLHFQSGQKLLSVWYDVDNQEWTSILYPCTALQSYPIEDEPESVVFRGQFEGETKTQYINAEWVVMLD